MRKKCILFILHLFQLFSSFATFKSSCYWREQSVRCACLTGKEEISSEDALGESVPPIDLRQEWRDVAR